MSAPSYQEVIDPSRLCFFCDQPATENIRAPLSREFPDGTGIVEIATREALPVRGRIEITGDACPAHYHALVAAIMDHYDVGGTSGRSLTRSTCPDAFHRSAAAYEAAATEPEPVGDGWSWSGFECPTCDFSSCRQYTVPSAIVDSPAYKYAIHSFGGGARVSP